jgi:WD40 repeat protein
MVLQGHTAAAFDLAYSPDGTRLVTTGLDKTVRVWDPRTGRELMTLAAHTMPVLAVAFEPDGKHFVTAASEQWSGPNFDRTPGEVKRWDTVTGKEVRTYPAPNGLPTLCVAVSPDGSRLVMGGGANGSPPTLTCLDLRTGAHLWTHEKEVELSWPYSAVDFSPDGRQIVGTCGKREVNVVNAGSGQLVFSTSVLPDPALAARYSPDGTWIAAAGVGKPAGIRVFDAPTGKRLPTIDTDVRWVRKLDFRRDGKLLAAAALFGVRVIDTASGQTVLSLNDIKGSVYGAAFSPDGTQLAVTAEDKLVRVYTLKTGDAPAPAPKGPARADAPDARKVAATFLELAIAGKVKEARAHAFPDNISEDKVKEFREVGLKRADVGIALAGATDALIITEPVEVPREGKGHLLLYLRQKDGKWLVRDIDFEPSDEALKKQRDFLERYPDARPVRDRK